MSEEALRVLRGRHAVGRLGRADGPQVDATVEGRRRERAAVRAEGDGVHRVLVPRQRRRQLERVPCGLPRRPQPHHSVEVAGGDEARIGRDADRCDAQRVRRRRRRSTITGGGGGGAVGGRLEHLGRLVVAAVGEVPDTYRVIARSGDDPGAGWCGGDREDVTGVAREGAPGEVEVVEVVRWVRWRWRRRMWRRRWWRWRRRSRAALTSAPASPSPTRSACSRRRRRRRTASLA